MLNEKEGLDLLFIAIEKATSADPIDWEIILVDDGSTDGTRDVLRMKLARFQRWKIVLLSRNFGQQPAYRAGLDAATGQAVIFLDADLQDPPELIGTLVAKWREGYKVVTACRTDRAEKGVRRFCFDLFHLIFHRMTDRTMPANSGMFSLVDRIVVDKLTAMSEVNLFLPALKCWFGYPQTTINYERKERAVGRPKQSFRKLFGYALNGLLSFSDLPLQFITGLGLLISVASFGYAVILLGIKVAQSFGFLETLEVKGFTTLAVSIFCLSGIQLLSLGIIGQYIARIYREVKNRPLYVVESVVTSHERR